jgi:hypothetical protein
LKKLPDASLAAFFVAADWSPAGGLPCRHQDQSESWSSIRSEVDAVIRTAANCSAGRSRLRSLSSAEIQAADLPRKMEVTPPRFQEKVFETVIHSGRAP